MRKYNVLILLVSFSLAGLLTQVKPAEARGFRLSQMPNATPVGAGCNLCHTTGGGTPRNDFGLAVEALVTPNGQEIFWGPELAALDSDGDGVSNGVELGDPDGVWVVGEADPSDAANISHPGDATSFIEQPEPEPTAVKGSTWGWVKGVAQRLID